MCGFESHPPHSALSARVPGSSAISQRTLPRAGRFIHRMCSRGGVLTLHRYEFNTRTGLFYPTYPTLAKYLNPIASWTFAARDRRFISLAKQAGVPVKVTEFSAAVGEAPGLTNSFATALWGANTLFAQLSEGIDGVNVHLRLKHLNSPVTASPSGGLTVNRSLLRDAARHPHARPRRHADARRVDRPDQRPLRLGGPRQPADDARAARPRAVATWWSTTRSERVRTARSCV